MKRMEKRWFRRAQAAGVLALLALTGGEMAPGDWGYLFLLLFLAAVGVLLWIMRRHLRCPGCGRCLMPWRTMEENRFCPACGTRFTWKETP